MFSFKQKPLYLLLLAGTQLLGIGLFCKGFFPFKVYRSGFASNQDLPSLYNDLQSEPEFDRLVFVVIDALRNDFIIGNDSGFDFVNDKINQGFAFPFTAKATAPTVTMPRIKALTTGTIPNFLDAILNIAESDTSSSLDFHDNWVYQFKNNGNKTIHFFGDDTWIRLFPGLFDKTDGTTSFFVSDTVEVDLNVTRHIQTDLVKTDWDAAILHYLGLDHIGHLSGPKSPLMKPKQKEMDQAIESIYSIVQKQDSERILVDSKAKGTLIVVCGDHGMNEKGNHGGSSVGETSAALVFLSPKFESRPSLKNEKSVFREENHSLVLGHPIIDQIDIVPTLSVLFGFPIPKNNLGKIVTNMLRKDHAPSVLYGLGLNAHQLGQLLSKLLPEVSSFITDPVLTLANDKYQSKIGQLYAEAFVLHKQYLSSATDESALDAIIAYNKFISSAQSHLANTASDYNLNLMGGGVLIMSLSALGFLILAVQLTGDTSLIWYENKLFSIFSLAAYSASMFSSSFVEEEHATWYYMIQTTFLLSAIHSLRLHNRTISDKLYSASLSIVQLVFVRLAIIWSDRNVSESILLSFFGLRWHLVALATFGSIVSKVLCLFDLKENISIDVNQTTSIVQNIGKLVLLSIAVLNSILVIAYKVKTEGGTDAPVIYTRLLDWELIQSLDQVQLGRLIFNYWGAGLFVLVGLFYMVKKASLMNIGQADSLSEKKSGLFLQLLLHLSTPIFVLLSGSQNALLFTIFNLQFKCLLLLQESLSDKFPVPVWLISVIISGLSHCSFFLTGHTNSIASIDLSNAYIGVKEYDTVLIGALTFCSNWAASIWWSIAGWALIANVERPHLEGGVPQPWFSFIVSQSTLFSFVLVLLSVSVTVLREHLFIWTVFSPKYLYQIAWCVLYHWIVQVVIGTIFTQILFKWPSNSDTAQSIEEEDDDAEEHDDTGEHEDTEEHDDIDTDEHDSNIDFKVQS